MVGRPATTTLRIIVFVVLRLLRGLKVEDLDEKVSKCLEVRCGPRPPRYGGRCSLLGWGTSPP